jgi:hypothetical protein
MNISEHKTGLTGETDSFLSLIVKYHHSFGIPSAASPANPAPLALASRPATVA